MTHQPVITICSDYSWTINRATFDKWNVSTSGEALESPLFGPACFGSIKFQMQLTYTDDSQQYELYLVLVTCDVLGELEVKYKKFGQNESMNLAQTGGYTKLETGGRCLIWKSKFLFDLYESFFQKINFQSKCKLSYDSLIYPELRALTQELNALREDSKIVDIFFDVGDKEFAANKFLLSARSSVFKRMFENTRFVENVTNRVKIDDFDQEVFEALLNFIYTAEVKNLNQIASALLPAAHLYDVKSLILVCAQSMQQSITIDSVVLYLVLSHRYDLTDLKRKCIDFINQNASKVTAREDFKKHVSSNCEFMKQLYLDMVDKHPSQ